jgi:DNA mismatch endonuclease (patch repair protein)
VDNKSQEARSRNMAAVKNKDTDLELTLRRALWHEGMRYRLNYRLPGRPDIVFPGKQVAVFCDGCFWHGCPEHGEIPVQNREFWLRKIHANKERDAQVTAELTSMGWVVLRYWGCEITKNLEDVVQDIRKHVRGEEPATDEL